MKTLYIIRHAKSSWNFDLDDHDRPLGIRGRGDVRKIAKYLSENAQTPELMISSTASRALYTALFIADEWSYPEDEIIITNNLYLSSPKDVMEIIKGSSAESIAVFGHNPGFTGLVNDLQDEYLDNLPTCGVYSISFQCDSWRDIGPSVAKKNFFITPKKLK